jgi:hypothetical protein
MNAVMSATLMLLYDKKGIIDNFKDWAIASKVSVSTQKKVYLLTTKV